MGLDDRAYLLARAEEERLRASQAPNDIVRAIHLKLAFEYATRADGGGTPAVADDEIIGRNDGGLRILQPRMDT